MRKRFSLLMVIVFMIYPALSFAGDDGVSRITIEKLKEKMGKGNDIIILDVRAKGSYDGSKFKIKGSLRIAPDEIETRHKELPLDKEIITYCT